MVKNIGTWWNSRNIDLVEVDGKVYALHGWNGEEYRDCWECLGENHMDAGENYCLRPIHRFEVEEIDLEELEENSPEWDRAVEIIDYEVKSWEP